MPVTLDFESVHVTPRVRTNQLDMTVKFKTKGKLSNGQEIDVPIAFNIQAQNLDEAVKKARELLVEFGNTLIKEADRVSMGEVPAVEKGR